MTQLINSFRFAEISDIIFSEDLTIEQFNKKKLSNIHILEKSKRVKYLNLEFVLNEGDIVFCNTEHVKLLFKLLKNNTKHKNLILITSQSDIEIDSKLLKKLPSCFSRWFCINSKIISDQIINIPLGIANNYEKNLKEIEIKYSPKNYLNLKKYMLYINFNVNTNRKVREPIYKIFKSDEDFYVSKYDSDKQNYQMNIVNSNFILCPEGNGLDTHRVWEVLYSGSIPIVKKFSGFESFKNLPILFVDKFEDINKEFLNKSFEKFEEMNFNLELLDFKYWSNFILKNKIVKNSSEIDSELIKVKKNTLFFYLILYNFSILKNKIYKYLTRKIWRIKKIFSYIGHNLIKLNML